MTFVVNAIDLKHWCNLSPYTTARESEQHLQVAKARLELEYGPTAILFGERQNGFGLV